MKFVALIGVILCAYCTIIAIPTHAQSFASCDTLAADPDDANHIGSGVSDGGIETARAIPACVSAVENEPSSGRLWFQLGRAYWEADNDEEAVTAFKKSALDLDYGPAYAYLGQAYEYGYGVERNATMARILYNMAIEGGYEPAQTMLDALPTERPINDLEGDRRVSFSGYKQPKLMQAFYRRDFTTLNQKTLHTIQYLRGLHEFFQTEVNWFDITCAFLHDTRLTQKFVRKITGMDPTAAGQNTAAIQRQIEQYIRTALNSGPEGIIRGLTDIMDLNSLIIEGKTDGGHLAIDYECTSDVVKTIYKNAQYYALSEISFLR